MIARTLSDMFITPVFVFPLIPIVGALGGTFASVAATSIPSSVVVSTGVRVVGGAAARKVATSAAGSTITRGLTAGRAQQLLKAAKLVPGQWQVPLRGQLSIAHRFEKPPQRWLAGHRGVDVVADRGAGSHTVHAANSGIVYFAGSVAGKPTVSVLHTPTLRTTYEPVIASVKAGDTVHVGQVIGRLRTNSGHCQPNSCLHWGAKEGLDYIDPLSLLGGEVRLLPNP